MPDISKPKALQPGDLVMIIAPAKAIESSHVYYAKELFESKGYKVQVSEHCLGNHHYFSGTDAQRTSDLQKAIDNPEVKAIICARGGYGCVRIVDRVQWAGIIREPKWMVGFSDVTVFHQRMQRYGIESLHATMPLNYQENSSESLDSLFKVLQGEPYSVSSPTNQNNKPGLATGKLIGGNLSILFSLLSTDDRPYYSDCILYIEDLSEQLYHIDRIFHTLRKSGILEIISGLVVGGMTDMKDTAIPFGKNLEEIILEHLEYRKIPICFNFPAGHIPDNQALILGRQCNLHVNSEGARLNFD
jgi:muramoyltetrapeptide carboxypeptidase